MRTPSLRRRVTFTSTLVLAVLLLAMNAFLYLTLRAQLEVSLEQVLDARLGIAVKLATQLPPAELAVTLTELGIPATVRDSAGTEFPAAPAVPRIGQYTPPAVVFHPRAQRTASLSGGETVTVYAARSGIDETLRWLLVLELLGTVVALGLAVFLLNRATCQALTPLQQVVDTAKRTTTGTTGLRLHPDRPDTELGHLAAAYDRMLDALEAALEQTRRSDERSQQFLADAAHQLRTPVTRIRTTVESLFRAYSPEDHDHLLTILVRETGRTGRLLSALLRMARLDRGGPPTRSPVDVVELCRTEIDRAEPFTPHLRFQLRLRNPPTALLDLDAEAVKEALANLLDNARRHAAHEITLEVSASNDTVRITVVDDGPGVPPDDRERIFERFASLDDQGGSGLGLPIARGIARVHGGDLSYTDTGFVLTCRATPARSPDPSQAEANSPSS